VVGPPIGHGQPAATFEQTISATETQEFPPGSLQPSGPTNQASLMSQPGPTNQPGNPASPTGPSSGSSRSGESGVSSVSTPSSPSQVSSQSSVSSPSARSISTMSISTGSISNRISGRTRTTSSRTSRSARRGTLGAGLLDVVPVPVRDPAEAVLEKPEVREKDRFCSGCNEPVGRSRPGVPGRLEGFCRKCGRRYSFVPRLKAADLVGGQYEVLGCLAYGGFGWIYLARDRNVNDRWVVLKGLLNAGDTEALIAAAAERAFLAEVEHPNIVKIYNFVRHFDPSSAQMVGYIVMEYVGGRSLKDHLLELRKEQGDYASIPLSESIAYILEVLRAFSYLHERGLLYCDFKPENAIQSEEQLKLIDLGGVTRIGAEGDIYGSVGYQAPEIATTGASIPSDLYTVGRTLAVLSFPFKGFSTKLTDRLPLREEVPLLQRYDSLDRFLRRSTHHEAGVRFQDASEMAEQLTGILREVLASEDGRPRPGQSRLFGIEIDPAGTEIPGRGGARGPVLGALDPMEAAAALPVPLVDPADPAATFLAGLTTSDPHDVLAALQASPVQSPEVMLMMTRTTILLGDLSRTEALLVNLASTLPGDWRVFWYDAMAALSVGELGIASERFDELYFMLPGEAATKLALGFARECAGDPAMAARLYETIWRTDRTYVSAAFGLARILVADEDRASAIRVLDTVPSVSSRYVPAQVATIACAVRGRRPDTLSDTEITNAAERLETLELDAVRHDLLAVEILGAAQALVRARRPVRPGTTVLGAPMTNTGLRRALDQTYRRLAQRSSDKAERRELVNQANAARPRTWV
jgi:serine/threonine-protein kinase PknG